MQERIRIILADGDAMYRTMCHDLMVVQPDIEVAGEVANIDDAPGLAFQQRPDILILGLGVGGQRGLHALERIHVAQLDTRVIAICEQGNQDDSLRAVKLGCRGIVQRNTPPELILKSVRKVYQGELWLDRVNMEEVLRHFRQETPSTPRSNPQTSPASPLSPRELEIVALVAQGFRNKTIAEKLAISEQTVKNHLHNIFDKLGVLDRLELALYAIHSGIYKQ
ncbi:MAG: two component transcriptional regulator, LuxR family [Bryobacterales bacterium]|nr:two component transcriptional regulator, LuxR family [Bryobacterales bacterium]